MSKWHKAIFSAWCRRVMAVLSYESRGPQWNPEHHPGKAAAIIKRWPAVIDRGYAEYLQFDSFKRCGRPGNY